MERRAFLALLASAPIAALAPLPKLLPDPQLGIALRFIACYEPLPMRYAILRPDWEVRITSDD